MLLKSVLILEFDFKLIEEIYFLDELFV